MNRLFILNLSILFLFGSPGLVAGNDQAFHEANSAYARGDFEQAVREYEEILRGHYSVSVLFNLGNAYFRKGEAGRAVLFYERALQLKPGDPDVHVNLEYVQNQLGIFKSPPPWWRSLFDLFSLNSWSRLTLLTMSLFLAALAFRMHATTVKWSPKPLIVILLLVLLCSAAGMVVRMDELDKAVVLKKDSPLKVAPVSNSPTVGTLTPGLVVHVEKELEEYFYVRTPEGKTGWMSKDTVEKIIHRG
jgi:tetratricopeptide (TPR) repeat protein